MFNLKKVTKKDRYGNSITVELDTMQQPTVPAMNSIPHPGEPKGTDTVPAWLTPGEFVMNAEATRMYEPQIKAMNDHGREVQRQQGGTIPEVEEDRFLNIEGSGGTNEYGTGYGGRATLNIPVTDNLTVSPYISGGGFKPKDGPHQGSVGQYGIGASYRFNQGGTVYASNGKMIEGEDFQRYADALREAESSNRMYGDDGNILTSRDGALGMMQVMPSTAAQPGSYTDTIFEMADKNNAALIDAGQEPLYKYDMEAATSKVKNKYGRLVPSPEAEAEAAKLLSRPELNLQYGDQLLHDTGTKLGGDLPATAAAYNAGLGGSRKVMAASEAGDLSTLPDYLRDETVPYVDKIMSKYDPSFRGLGSPDVNPLAPVRADSEEGKRRAKEDQELYDQYMSGPGQQAVPPIAAPEPVSQVNDAQVREYQQTLKGLKRKLENQLLFPEENKNSIEETKRRIAEVESKIEMEQKPENREDYVEARKLPQIERDRKDAKENLEEAKKYREKLKENNQDTSKIDKTIERRQAELDKLIQDEDTARTSKDAMLETMDNPPVGGDLARLEPKSPYGKPVPMKPEGADGVPLRETPAPVEEHSLFTKEGEFNPNNTAGETLESIEGKGKKGVADGLFSGEQLSRVGKFFTGMLDKFINEDEMQRAVFMYLGSRLMGYNHDQSFTFVGKQYGQRLKAREAMRDKLYLSGKYTPKSVKEAMDSGDLSALELADGGYTVEGTLTMYKNGKPVRVQKVKDKKGNVHYITPEGKRADNTYKLDDAFEKGTPKYRERFEKSVNSVEEDFKDVYNVKGRYKSGDDWKPVIESLPARSAARQFVHWAEENGLDPDAPEVRMIMTRAYEQAIKDVSEGDRIKDLNDLKPYYEAQDKRIKTGTSKLFQLNADKPNEIPKYVDADRMQDLYNNVDYVARNHPDATSKKPVALRRNIHDALLKGYGKLKIDDPVKYETYEKAADEDASVTGFYLYSQDMLKDWVYKQQQ